MARPGFDWVKPRDPEQTDDFHTKIEEQRIEAAKQRFYDNKVKWELYLESLPEGQRDRVRNLETARRLLAKYQSGPPNVNDLIKLAGYVASGDTTLIQSELDAQAVLRRPQ